MFSVLVHKLSCLEIYNIDCGGNIGLLYYNCHRTCPKTEQQNPILGTLAKSKISQRPIKH